MYLIAGLGNPGAKFEQTRHNVGFLTLDIFAEKWDIPIKKLKFKSLYGEGSIHGEKVILVKPQTYMNLSGESIREWVNFYKIPMDHLIVIQDDIDLPVGKLRIRPKGSAGTHNGMKSIIYQLQRDDFPRIKIGVGQQESGEDLAHYVLSGFLKEEKEIMEEAILDAAKALQVMIEEDVETAMNQFNGNKKAR